MTTIDERLDEVFDGYNGLIDHEYQGVAYDREDAKAAIRKLFLDLIAEAKPDGRSIVQPDLGEIPDGVHWAHFKGQEYAINEFENNLIQAINGGKK
jgi:hypothetical protein